MLVRRAMRAPEVEMVATGPGLYTNSKPGDRKVVPDDPNGREVFKVVYVVLESQYQASLTTACKRINAGQVRHAPRARVTPQRPSQRTEVRAGHCTAHLVCVPLRDLRRVS